MCCVQLSKYLLNTTDKFFPQPTKVQSVQSVQSVQFLHCHSPFTNLRGRHDVITNVEN